MPIHPTHTMHAPDITTLLIPSCTNMLCGSGTVTFISVPATGALQLHHCGGVYVPMTTPLKLIVRDEDEHSTPVMNDSEAVSITDPTGVVSVQVNPIC